MIVVIIAGGSGTRLWPLSTQDYPKHLLSLTNDRSLLQNTYDRVKNLADDIFVITEKSHSKFVIQQLPDLPRKNFLIEPARRGTAACLVLAMAEIKRRKLSSQTLTLLWADQLIKNEEAFTKALIEADKLAAAEQKLVFTGVKPTYASTGFGYIELGKKVSGNAYELKQFVEKPNKPTAERYYKSKKYIWNTGPLTGLFSAFERELREHSPRLWNDYRNLSATLLPLNRRKVYLGFVSEALEYALSEHVPDALAIVGGFDWTDLGSFRDLHGVSEQDKDGNTLSGEKIEMDAVKNSLVRNESDVPVAVIGLENVAVIATENGILVTNKEQAQKVGDISKKLQAENKKGFKWLEKL